MALTGRGACDLWPLCGNRHTTVYRIIDDTGYRSYCAGCWPVHQHGPLEVT